MRSTTILLLIVSLLFSEEPSDLFSQSDIAQIQESFIQFTPKIATAENSDIGKYLNYYGYGEPSHFSYGKVTAAGYEIACFYFEPKNPVGTVLIFHGYLDNSGVLAKLQKQLLNLNYAVLMVDLPGHGFSSGSRGSINSFSQYGEVAHALIELHNKVQLTEILHVMGHSTGGAVILEQLYAKGKTWSGETILIAPLVRSAYWGISRWGYKLAKPFATESIRLYRESSHYEPFLTFLRNEPLRIDTFPFQWGDALYVWNDKLEDASFPDVPLTVIQGTEDKTVAWKYNTKFYSEQFPQSKIHYIEDGRHHLLNESDLYLGQVTEIIESVLNRSLLKRK
jgi:alpha-beta hydrolase superfamily lysophospholipase